MTTLGEYVEGMVEGHSYFFSNRSRILGADNKSSTEERFKLARSEELLLGAAGRLFSDADKVADYFSSKQTIFGSAVCDGFYSAAQSLTEDRRDGQRFSKINTYNGHPYCSSPRRDGMIYEGLTDYSDVREGICILKLADEDKFVRLGAALSLTAAEVLATEGVDTGTDNIKLLEWLSKLVNQLAGKTAFYWFLLC